MFEIWLGLWKQRGVFFSFTVSAKILEQEDYEKMGIGLYLDISACSAKPPKIIHLTYSPSGRDLPGKQGALGKLDGIREAITAAHTQHLNAA
ncbi:hypothetical protein WJX74_006762 [Apatococcus lobatus]|uniref:Uncharacterized protein n=1 Tax=Apatococcus lobatus TaxID=904363 RepID=A0AAW1SH39_9CHLO